MTCPQCGAAVKEGRFCSYCGAKLEDNVKRSEVYIEKRIEDVAEMKRADYESEESRLRQKQMAAEFHSRKVKRISSITIIVLGIAVIVFVMNLPKEYTLISIAVFALVGAGLFFVIGHVISELIHGRW